MISQKLLYISFLEIKGLLVQIFEIIFRYRSHTNFKLRFAKIFEHSLVQFLVPIAHHTFVPTHAHTHMWLKVCIKNDLQQFDNNEESGKKEELAKVDRRPKWWQINEQSTKLMMLIHNDPNMINNTVVSNFWTYSLLSLSFSTLQMFSLQFTHRQRAKNRKRKWGKDLQWRFARLDIIFENITLVHFSQPSVQDCTQDTHSLQYSLNETKRVDFK